MSEQRMREIAEYLVDYIADRFEYDGLVEILSRVNITEEELAEFGYGDDE